MIEPREVQRTLHIINGIINSAICIESGTDDLLAKELIVRHTHQFCSNYRPKITKDDIQRVLSSRLDCLIGLSTPEDEL